MTHPILTKPKNFSQNPQYRISWNCSAAFTSFHADIRTGKVEVTDYFLTLSSESAKK